MDKNVSFPPLPGKARILTIDRVMKLVDENDVIQRRAGIVWKNLKVCGSGSAINLQKNVGSLLLAPLRLGKFFSKGPEKTILNEFDGVLKSGEMLVVLGRPGSGCSTLLKSLMGELHGLDMKPQSEVHYNGKFLPSISLVSPPEFPLRQCTNATLTRYYPKANAEAISRRDRLQPGS